MAGSRRASPPPRPCAADAPVPPRLRGPRAPAEGRGRHPVYRPGPPAPARTARKRPPGAGPRERTAPGADAGPAWEARGPAPRLLRVTPVTTPPRTSPPALNSAASADPSRGSPLRGTALGPRGLRTPALTGIPSRSPPRLGRHPRRTTHPHLPPEAGGEGGLQAVSLQFPHDDAHPRPPRHLRSS
ncbi:PREDICTED: basic proline-rich protein-like [Chinchilla lanigera]|uniref:basic proline-rich protein-like n=1 Tax=Chinchilla lanigera TaxID=34839 RepID=UPI000697E534|nr:PREDICTED: basic proline-rich protein-like [Chinchilla lanigera]